MKMKKVTQKDRYGNQISYEFEAPEKPLDPTRLMEKSMEMMSQMAPPPPVMGEEFNMGNPTTHPGGPRGEDTVPAWLTPGEFVVNKEATQMFGPQIEAMNNVGRMAQGGTVQNNTQPPAQYAWWGGRIRNAVEDAGREALIGAAEQDPRSAAENIAGFPDKIDTITNLIPYLGIPFGFNEGGSVPYDLQNPKNLTQAQRNELSYEDPILLNHIKDKMAERKKRFQDWGFNVEHEYGAPPELDYAFEAPHSPSKGMWHARLGTGDSQETWVHDPTVNIPATPSLANYLVGEEEYSHMLGGWDPNRPEEGTYGVNDRLFEEMRAKQEAARNVGGYLTPNVSRVFDDTLSSYIGANQLDRSEAELPAMGRDEMLELWNRSNITPGRSGFYNADTGFYKTLQDAVEGGTRGHNWVPFMYNDGGAVPIPYDQALLEAREGYRDDVYLDSLGKPTVGHGHLLGDEYMDRVGETPFSKEELDSMFQQDIASARAAARRNATANGVDWDSLNRQQQGALTSQAFQLGETGQGKFKKMWAAMAAGDNEGVRREAMDSNWYKQTPTRVEDLVQAFNTGGEVPFIAAPLMFEPEYRVDGGEIEGYAVNGKLPSGQSLRHYNSYGPTPATTIWMDTLNTGRPDKTGELVEPDLGIPPMTQHPMGDIPTPSGALPDIDMSVPGMSVPPNVAGEVTDAGERVSGAQALPVNVDSIVEEMYGTPTGGGGRGGKKPGSIEDHTQVTGGGGRGGRRGSRGEAIDANAARQGYVPATTQTMADNKDPQIGQSKIDNAQKQLDRAKEVLANTDPDSQYYQRRLETVKNRKRELQEAQTKMSIKNTNEDARNIIAANQEAAEMRRKADALKDRLTGDPETDEIIQEQIDTLTEQADQTESAGGGAAGSAGDQQTSSGATVTEVADAAGAESGDADEIASTVTEQAAENAAGNASKEQVEQSEGMMKSIFGDLFDPSELKRAAIMYLGSRMMGYSHGGSLSWALKGYVGRVDGKTAAAQKQAAVNQQQAATLASTGKFTPDSIAKFQRTGNTGDLKPLATSGGKPPKITNTKVMVPGQGLVQVYEAGDGTQVYLDKNGRPQSVVGSGARVYDAATMGEKAVKEEFGNWTSNELGKINQGVGQDDENYVSVNNARVASDANIMFQKLIRDSRIPSNDAEYVKNNIGLAINDFVAAKKAFNDGNLDKDPQSVTPFIEARMMSAITGVSPATLAGVNMENQYKINKRIKSELKADGVPDNQMNNEFQKQWQSAQAVWATVPAKQKEKYQKLALDGQNGFTVFMTKLLNDDPEALSFVSGLQQ